METFLSDRSTSLKRWELEKNCNKCADDNFDPRSFLQLNRTLKKMPLSVTAASGAATGRWFSKCSVWQPKLRITFLCNRKNKHINTKNTMCWLLTTTRWKQCSIMKKELPWNHHYRSILLFLFFLCHNFPCICMSCICYLLHHTNRYQKSLHISFIVRDHPTFSFYYHRPSNIFQHMTNDKNGKEIKMYKKNAYKCVCVCI